MELCKEYDFAFNASVTIYMLVIALLAWIWMYALVLSPIAGVVMLISLACLVALYIFPAAYMNETFDKFKDLVWKHGQDCINRDNEANNKHYYHHLVGFMSEYPLLIKTGSFTVTRVNAISLLSAFIAARYATYAVQSFT